MLNVLLLLRCNQLLVLQEFLLLLLLLLLHHCMLLLHQLLLLHVLHVLHVLLLLLLLRQVQMGPGRTRWHVRGAHLHVATCWRHRHMVQRRVTLVRRCPLPSRLVCPHPLGTQGHSPPGELAGVPPCGLVCKGVMRSKAGMRSLVMQLLNLPRHSVDFTPGVGEKDRLHVSSRRGVFIGARTWFRRRHGINGAPRPEPFQSAPIAPRIPLRVIEAVDRATLATFDALRGRSSQVGVELFLREQVEQPTARHPYHYHHH